MNTSLSARFRLFALGVMLTLLAGCATYRETDVTADYINDPEFRRGYRVGGVYELQADLFVTKLDRPHYVFMKPGDSVPKIAAWDAGDRRSAVPVVGPARRGTRVRVEKVVLISSPNGISQVTCMFRAEGFDRLITPFMISNLVEVHGGKTLCAPDPSFLKEVP